MIRELVFLKDSSNVVEVQKLVNKITGTYLDGTAQVKITLLDQEGVAVTGGPAFPVDLNYVGGSQGVFRTTLSAALAMTPPLWYQAILEVTSGTLTWKKRLPVRVEDA